VSAGPAESAADGAQPAAADTNEAPTAQLAHAPPLYLYVPAGHAAQLAAPADDVVPAAQAVQPAAETVPLPVTVPKKPGAHAVHAATELLPFAPPVVVKPAGHAVHAAAPDVDE